MAQTANFFAPGFDEQVEQQNIERQRKMAELLRQQSAEMPQGSMVSGHYVAPSFTQGLAKMLQAYNARAYDQDSNEKQKQLAEAIRTRTQDELGTFTKLLQGEAARDIQPLTPNDDEGNPMPVVRKDAVPGDLNAAYQFAAKSQTPALQQFGVQGALTQAQEAAKLAQAEALRAQKFKALNTLGPAEAVRQGIVTQQEAEGFANAGNIGKPEVARTADVAGPNGEKLVQPFDKYGNPIGQPVPAYMAPVQVNRGNVVEFVTPTAGKSLPVGMSPAERDASARGWATVNQGARRLELESRGGLEKPPAGYRFKQDGSLEAIPGGPAAGKDGQKPLTESQAKGSLYLGQMRSASAELEKLPHVSPVSTAASDSTYTNWAVSEAGQRVAQLQNQWAEAYLRAKTGAAATKDEVDLNRRTFFPVVGDKPGQIEQKRKMREQAERDMAPVAGPGAATAGINPETAGKSSSNANSVNVGGKVYQRPPSMTDKQWADYKKAVGAQ